MRITLIVAIAENGVIGRDGGLPWHISTDLKAFRRLTIGKPVIMGRKTFQSLKAPLDGRLNIVVTRDRHFAPAGAVTAHNLEAALAMARDTGADEAAVIGGADIFRLALPLADRIQLTEVHAAPPGDTTFTIDRSRWREAARQRLPAGPKDDHDISFVTLERLAPEP